MRRLGMALLLLIGFALVAALYVVKTRTASAEQEVRRLEKALAQEEAAIVASLLAQFIYSPHILDDWALILEVTLRDVFRESVFCSSLPS